MNSYESHSDDRPISWPLVVRKVAYLVGIFVLWGVAFSLARGLASQYLVPPPGTQQAAQGYAFAATIIVLVVSMPFLLWWLRVYKNLEVRADRPSENSESEGTSSRATFRGALAPLARGGWLGGNGATWAAAIGAVAIMFSVAFPPWVLPETGWSPAQRLGYGTFFSPPRAFPLTDTKACMAAEKHQQELNKLRSERAAAIQTERNAIERRKQHGSNFERYLDGLMTPEELVDNRISVRSDSLGEARNQCMEYVRRMTSVATIDYPRLGLQIVGVIALTGLIFFLGRIGRLRS